MPSKESHTLFVLYDWVVNECEMDCKPQQIEFARLNMTNTVMSKRKLKMLVDEAVVDGWDDPRMPTIAGLRRRGYTPESIRSFCREIGVSKADSVVDSQMLDFFLREDLQPKAVLGMAVLRPLKLVITNYPEGQTEMLEVENNAKNEAMGTRLVPFSRELYIEQLKNISVSSLAMKFVLKVLILLNVRMSLKMKTAM